MEGLNIIAAHPAVTVSIRFIRGAFDRFRHRTAGDRYGRTQQVMPREREWNNSPGYCRCMNFVSSSFEEEKFSVRYVR